MSKITLSTHSDSESPRSLTVLVCAVGHVATKRFARKGIDVVKIDFNAGMFFGIMVKQVRNIHELSSLLIQIENLPAGFVIRGAPLKNLDHNLPFRRLNENFKTPIQGLYWVLIDFDKIKLPDNISLNTDCAAAIEYLINLLPIEFTNVSYHWQLSSSAGMSDPSLLSAHIWFYFDRPVKDQELRDFAKYVNDKKQFKLIDPALFRDVQPHYTAAPLFDNVIDPFPIRSGLVKKEFDEVEFQSYTPIAINTEGESNTAKKTRLGDVGKFSEKNTLSVGPKFEFHLESIGDHAGGNGFHEPIIRAISSYVATHGKDDTDIDVLYQIISKQVFRADCSHHIDKRYIERMASRDHIIPAIKTAIIKFGNNAKSKKSSLLSGIAAPNRAKPISVAEAYKTLSDNIARWF